MHKLTHLIASTALVGVLATAAHAQSAQLPTPANPTPLNPVATDGSPLPLRGARGDGLVTGRSAFVPVRAAVELGTETLGAAVAVVPDTLDGLADR